MVDQSTAAIYSSDEPGGGSAGSTGSAKDKASAAAQTAADSGSQVAQTAVQHTGEVAQTAADQAKNVVAEAGNQARDLLGEARGQLQEQAQSQHQNAISSLRALGDELHTMARNTRDSGQAGMGTEVVHQAADRAHGVADWLSQREPGDLFGELRSFAQRRPGAFLLGAAVAGVLAGRLTRGITAAAHDDGAGGRTTGTEAGYPSQSYARPGDVTQAIDTPVEPMGSELPPSGFGAPGGSPALDSPFAGGVPGGVAGGIVGGSEVGGGFGTDSGFGAEMPRTPGERPLPGDYRSGADYPSTTDYPPAPGGTGGTR